MFISFEQVKEFPGEMELMIVLKAKKKKKQGFKVSLKNRFLN